MTDKKKFKGHTQASHLEWAAHLKKAQQRSTIVSSMREMGRRLANDQSAWPPAEERQEPSKDKQKQVVDGA